jgi:hypothetical protein
MGERCVGLHGGVFSDWSVFQTFVHKEPALSDCWVDETHEKIDTKV